MDPETVNRRAGELQLVDVREPEEWQDCHLPGARHIPMAQVDQRLDELDPDRPVVTVCRSGARSAQVAEALAGRGYDAANMDGGQEAWQQQGLPVVTD